MGKRIRNGEEYLSLRTARKRHHCESQHTGCTGVIEPGDRYVLAELPPGGEAGYERWLRVPVCEPCGHVSLVAERLFGHAIPVVEWLIWSNHHRCWWGPNGSGYRRHIADAGRYAKADTPQWLGRGCGCCRVPEVLVPAPAIHLLATPGALAEYGEAAPKHATHQAIRMGLTSPHWKAGAR